MTGFEERTLAARARSRFLALLGMTDRKARAKADTGISPLRITKAKE
jgi:hypothetical protein